MRPPKRLSSSEQIAKLQKQLECRLAELQAVKQEQEQLLLRQKVLEAYCDTAALVRQQRAGASCASDVAVVLQQEQQQQWASEAEAALLQQLQEQPCRASVVPTLYWAGRDARARIGFAFVRLVTCQPVDPRAASMTLPELVATYRAMVQDLSLLLHVVEAGGEPPGSGTPDAAAAVSPCEQLKELLLRHLRLFVSLEQCGRGHVCAELTLTNCDTGEQQSAADGERHRWAAERLQLSRLQRREIAESVRTANQLLASVRGEAARLRALLADACDAPAGHAPVGSSSSSNSSSGSSGSRGASVEERQEWASRLGTLARKERWLLTMQGGLGISCLSWVQLAKVNVLLYPHHPAYAVLAAVIAADSADDS